MGINHSARVIEKVLEEKSMPKFFEQKTHNTSEFGRRAALTNASMRTISQRTFEDVESDIKLRKLLKRAVMREQAPPSLIEAIRIGIRK
jgi:hypothetical protein